jgi:DNA invertase Pin-like site-specific DNA recombinase
MSRHTTSNGAAPAGALRALGYCRVSTVEQSDHGASLESQTGALEAEAERRGWRLVDTVSEVGSGKSADARLRLQETLIRLDAGEADILIVSRLDRLTRSLLDFAAIVKRAQKHGWTLVAIEQAFDLSKPEGRMLSGILAVFADYERDLISARTRDALAVKKSNGVRLGRRSTLPETVRDRIYKERADGRTLQEIADALNGDGIPTGQGGRRWYPSAVRVVAATANAELEKMIRNGRAAS